MSSKGTLIVIESTLKMMGSFGEFFGVCKKTESYFAQTLFNQNQTLKASSPLMPCALVYFHGELVGLIKFVGDWTMLSFINDQTRNLELLGIYVIEAKIRKKISEEFFKLRRMLAFKEPTKIKRREYVKVNITVDELTLMRPSPRTEQPEYEQSSGLLFGRKKRIGTKRVPTPRTYGQKGMFNKSSKAVINRIQQIRKENEKFEPNQDHSFEIKG